MQSMFKAQDATTESRITSYNDNLSHVANPYGLYQDRVKET